MTSQKNIDQNQLAIAVFLQANSQKRISVVCTYFKQLPMNHRYSFYITHSNALSHNLLDQISELPGEKYFYTHEDNDSELRVFSKFLSDFHLEKYDLLLKIANQGLSESSFENLQNENILSEFAKESTLLNNIFDTFNGDSNVTAIGALDALKLYSTQYFSHSAMPMKKEVFSRFLYFHNDHYCLGRKALSYLKKELAAQEHNSHLSKSQHLDHYIGFTLAEAGHKVAAIELGKSTLKKELQNKDIIKVICFFLPQFHEIPENNKWWGPGFTEWTNLNKSKPLYEGHQILTPHSSVGQYNLLDLNTRKRQADQARDFNIHAFCFHHYWFKGKKILEKPVNLLLEDGEPNIHFCFNWANEPWSRSWDGLDKDILINQDYGDKDDWAEHLEYLIPFFRHTKYIKIDGSPIFLLYRIGHIENYNNMISYWKEKIKDYGFPDLKIFMVLGNFDESQPEKINLSQIDAMVEFQPQHTARFPNSHATISMTPCWQIDTRQIWKICENTPKRHPNYFKGTFPSWDNTIRKGLTGRTYSIEPTYLFRDHLKTLVEKTLQNPSRDDQYIFINAWNEWAEGAVVEPTENFTFDVLAAIKEVLDSPLVLSSNG